MSKKKLSKKSISVALGTSPKFLLLTTRDVSGEQNIVKLQPDVDSVLSQEIDLYGLTFMQTLDGFEIGYESNGFISSEALHRKLRALIWLERKFNILCERVGDPLNFGSSVAYCAAVLGVEEIVISGDAYPIREAVRHFSGGVLNGELFSDGGEIPSKNIERREVGLLGMEGVKEVVGEEDRTIGVDVQPADSEAGGCPSDILEVISESEEDR